MGRNLKLTTGTEGSGKLHVPKELMAALPRDENGEVSVRFRSPVLTEDGILFKPAPPEEVRPELDLPSWLTAE